MSGYEGPDHVRPDLPIPARCVLICAGIVLPGCSDGPTSPPAFPEVVVETPRQWSGSPVSLRSAGFADGSTIRIALVGDTLEADTGESPDLRRFVLPPLLTGMYEAHVLVGDYAVPISLEVVGLARPPLLFAGGCCASTVTNVQGTGDGKAYFADEGDFCEPATLGAYCVVNLSAPGPGTAIPGLLADEVDRIQLSVPGPSHREDHLVFDIAPSGTSDARVYRLEPSVEPVGSLPCDRSGSLSNTIAEISPTTCLQTVWPGEIWRNGVDLVISDDFGYEDAQFRIGPGAERTALVTRWLGEDEAIRVWPVFDSEGNLLYTADRYEHVPGTAFSEDGRVIWVAARDRNDIWRLDELDASTGSAIRSLLFPDAVMLMDVLRDPVDGQLYVASTDDRDAPVLHAVDEETLELMRSVPAPLTDASLGIRMGGVLEPGGSDGRVHLLAWHAIDAGWHVWSFDR